MQTATSRRLANIILAELPATNLQKIYLGHLIGQLFNLFALALNVDNYLVFPNLLDLHFTSKAAGPGINNKSRHIRTDKMRNLMTLKKTALYSGTFLPFAYPSNTAFFSEIEYKKRRGLGPSSKS